MTLTRGQFLLFVSGISWVKCLALLIFFVWLTPSSQRLGYYPDSQIYEAIANNLVSGAGFSTGNKPPYKPTMIKEPLYPMIIAVMKWAFGLDLAGVVVVQMLTNPLIAVLVYLLGVELFNEKVARLSSLLVAIIPVYGVISFWVMPENFFLILFSATMLVLVWAGRSDGWAVYLVSGALLGLCALAKNVVLPLVVLYPTLIVICRKGLDKARFLRNAALFVLAFSLLTTPWMLRNKEKLGLFSISARGGALLSHQAAWAANFTLDEWKAYSLYVFTGSLAQKLYPQVLGEDLGEYEYSVLMRRSYVDGLMTNHKEGEVDRILIREALQNIREHPFKFAFLSILAELQSVKYLVPTGLTMLKGPAGWQWLLQLVRLALLVLGVILTFLTIKGLLRSRDHLCKYSMLLVAIACFHIASAFLGIIPGSIPRYILPVTVFYSFFIVIAVLGLEAAARESATTASGPLGSGMP